MTKQKKMQPHNPNINPPCSGVVWFLWNAAESAHTLGQLVSIGYSDTTPDVAFTYDRLGRQLTVTDVLGTRTNVYDALNLLEERHPDGTTLVRSYDLYGRPVGIALGPDYAVGYGYDEYGRFSTVAVSNGATFTYSYVPNSSLLAGYTNDLGLAVAYEYEPHRDLKTLVSNAWSTNPISTFAYTYDPIGRRTQRIDDSATTNLFGYNLRSELVSAEMGTNTYTYAYDPIGNRLSSTENGLLTTYAANSLNQYTALNPSSPTPTPFTYDPDGNMTQYGDLAFFWDAENRLLGVASNDTFLVTNRYDFMSRRIEKATSTETKAFLYDGWNLLRETTSSTSAFTTNHYVWGLDLSGTIQGAGGIGGLLVQRHSGAGTPWFSFCDANGNVSDLLNGDGTPAARYEYDAYGNTTVQSGTQALANLFRFSSKYSDGEHGLHDYGHRFYSPKLGRWTCRDMAGEEGGINLNGFAENSPIVHVDVLGLGINDPPHMVSASCCNCCCVENLKIENIRPLDELGWYGHTFDVVIDTRWALNSPTGVDCKLEWWEWSTRTILGFSPRTWRDMFSQYPVSETFAPWVSRLRQPRLSNHETTIITDIPSGALASPSPARQILYFAIKVSSAPNCNCEKQSLVVYAYQHWNIANGAGLERDFRVLNSIPESPGYPPGFESLDADTTGVP